MRYRRTLARDTVLLKIGGSVLTTRDEPPAFRTEEALRIAAEIKDSGRPVVVLHGTGRFTKRLVAQEGASHDLLPEQSGLFAATFWQAATAVNNHLVAAFGAAGVNAVPIPPVALFESRGGRLTKVRLDTVSRCLHRGLVPLVHGGVLLDGRRGYYLCSSDQMMAALAKALRPDRVLFASDVEGIFRRWPPDVGDGPIRVVGPRAALELAGVDMDERTVGGMRDKLSHALGCASFANRCLVFDGLVSGRLRQALLGFPVVGTEVHCHG